MGPKMHSRSAIAMPLVCVLRPPVVFSFHFSYYALTLSTLYLNHIHMWSLFSSGNLRAEKAKLDIIAENMHEGAILLDDAYRVLFVNPAARTMLSVPRNITDSTKILSAFRNKFQGIDITTCVSAAMPGEPFHVPGIEVDSEIYQIFFTRLSEVDQQRYKAHALVWIEDITEAKMLERRKSEFVTVVAHQLRTPLSGLKWTLHMLSSGDLGKLSDAQKTFLLKSYENNERMIALVNDMLAADRIESGRMKYTLLRINLRDLMENVLFEIFPEAQKRGIKIDFVCPSESKFTVLVDSVKLRAVLQNLLENAIKYTMKGGTVTITLEQAGSDVKVAIRDTGIGIPEANQSQIFSRFFRASNAVIMEPSGTGLGLYMVKKIVEQHKGNVWFTSEEGHGSTFFITIPVVSESDIYKQI